MVTNQVRQVRLCMGVRRQTKDSLDSIKHPGQSYDGVIQELIKFWEEEHEPEETSRVPLTVGRAGCEEGEN